MDERLNTDVQLSIDEQLADEQFMIGPSKDDLSDADYCLAYPESGIVFGGPYVSRYLDSDNQ